ncbi:unnamed protein product, partial [Ectocarpus sp. 12 AP-2014]
GTLRSAPWWKGGSTGGLPRKWLLRTVDVYLYTPCIDFSYLLCFLCLYVLISSWSGRSARRGLEERALLFYILLPFVKVKNLERSLFSSFWCLDGIPEGCVELPSPCASTQQTT